MKVEVDGATLYVEVDGPESNPRFPSGLLAAVP